jgi:hypothetical protein
MYIYLLIYFFIIFSTHSAAFKHSFKQSGHEFAAGSSSIRPLAGECRRDACARARAAAIIASRSRVRATHRESGEFLSVSCEIIYFY